MWDPDLFKRALDFAARAHGEQKVPGNGFPYVVHLVKVAAEVLHACAGDPSLDADLALVCALGHDSLEDAGVTYEALAEEFGVAAANGVRALTKDESLPKPARMADSLRRIRQEPREVWLVKLADRVTNLEPPPPGWSLEKRRVYLTEAGEIHAALEEAHSALAARLMQKMREYEAYCS
jgi:(p)ppGpp synthase/HD superfamily hydrolase